jgi:exoribonuclease R
VPISPLRLSEEAASAELVETLAAIRAELAVADRFPAEVEAEAADAAQAYEPPTTDLRDLPFATIDPAGATDLDQAFHLERDGAGYRVLYAIADLPAFVRPGGAIDTEARQRGQTLYAADGRVPLHPTSISEHAASLLPDVDRGAYVWDIRLDAAGRAASTRVGRARIRSRRRWAYDEAQDAVPREPGLRLLAEIGDARLAQESERGGASLATPEILVTRDAAGYHLRRRILLPIEQWNAQLSLLTGMEAAALMLSGRVGILRTMPPADADGIARFRRQARALGTPWAPDVRYGDYLRSLRGDDPRHLAIRHAASSLFRGATYLPFDGDVPHGTGQAAIGAPYAHVTAPLRRLVDRFGLVVCAALSAGETPPEWVRAALPELPTLMARAGNAAGRLDRMTLDAVEAAVLAPRVGDVFDAVVLSASDRGATIQLLDPAVEAPSDGPLTPGTDVQVRLVTADIRAATVRFEPA